MKKIALMLVASILATFALTACGPNDADVASKNLSTDADNYKVLRQIVVYNSFTDKYILEVDGFCALGNNDPADEVSYTCKTPQGLVKDIIKKSDNTFVFVHQLDPRNVSVNHYTVTFKPESVVPSIQPN